MRARLEKLGLYRKSGHEHFSGSLVVPVMDEAGNVSEVYGRKINDHLRPGTPMHLYLPGPHRGVWNAQAVAASREIIVCEALIDAMTFWCAGFRNVTSSYGIEGFTDEMLQAFKAHSVSRALIAYDRDDAGERAAAKLAERLMAEGIECWRIQFPKGMDANEYALKVAPAAKSLGVAIRKAVWLGKSEAPAPIVESVIESPPPIEPSPLAAEVPIVEAPAIAASPVPPAVAPEPEAQVKESEIAIVFGDRRYRVRGLAKNMSYDVMKVNVLASRGERFHVDTFDLYAAKARGAFTVQAAIELAVSDEVIKGDLGRLLLKLEQLQDEQIQKALAPKAVEAVPIDEHARREALALLKSPQLLDRILADFEACGIVGETTNKLVGYLAAVSRKLERPLAVLIQSSSAAGKSSLMEAMLAFMPEEERVKFSAMTGQSLFYMGETDLQNKILAIVEEEGVSRASYALKLLQSEGELSIASTGKDPQSGNLVTQEYRVKGPVMMFLTTTAVTIDEELLNRCLVLTVDEDREQTAAIHRLQRERRTLQGLKRRQERESLIELHRNAQRLLKPLAVVNPFAERLTFPDAATRLRRDHEKYLTLIDAIALLQQHQREVKAMTWQGHAIEYIEVELADVAQANAIAHEVLGRSLDEVPPQTRRLLREIVKLVQARAQVQDVKREAVRFTRRELRASLAWGDTQLKTHLARLVELEYVLAHRDGQGFVYELAYDGDGSAEPHLSGLIDVERLYDAKRSGRNSDRSDLGRPLVGDRPGTVRGDDVQETSTPADAYASSSASAAKTHISKGSGADASYTQPLPLAAAPRA